MWSLGVFSDPKQPEQKSCSIFALFFPHFIRKKHRSQGGQPAHAQNRRTAKKRVAQV